MFLILHSDFSFRLESRKNHNTPGHQNQDSEHSEPSKGVTNQAYEHFSTGSAITNPVYQSVGDVSDTFTLENPYYIEGDTSIGDTSNLEVENVTYGLSLSLEENDGFGMANQAYDPYEMCQN